MCETVLGSLNLNRRRHGGGGEKGIHLEVTRNGDEEECNRGSGKAEKAEKTKCAGRQARKGKERKAKKMNAGKVRNVDEKARGHADRRRRCNARERKDESGVSRNAVRVWRTKAKETE